MQVTRFNSFERDECVCGKEIDGERGRERKRGGIEKE
jgi:hypothetical protein